MKTSALTSIVLLLWIAALPFEAFLAERVGMSPYVVLTPVAVLALAFPAFLRLRWGYGLAMLVLGACIMGLGLLNAALGLGPALDPQRLRGGLAILVLAIIAQGIASCAREDRFVCILAGTLAIAAGCAAWVGWHTSGLSWRISIADSVRQLANFAGLAAVLAIAAAVTDRHHTWDSKRPPGWVSTVPWLIVAGIMITIVVATISRGVLLAVSVGTCAMVATTMFAGTRRAFVIRNLLLATGVGLMGILIWLGAQAIDEALAGGRLTGRIILAIDQPADNPRWLIWRAGLADRTLAEWLVGGGIGQFQVFASRAGMDYYAHSVWVDTFGAVGLIGVTVLAMVCARVIAVGVATRDPRIAGVAAFMIISFATHGSLGTKGFWLTLGILWGMSSGAPVRSTGARRPLALADSRSPSG